MNDNTRGNWNSRLGFILAAAGSAVGLGNIWRFPYATGENGGALFVLIYIIAVLVIAMPVMLAEITLGRASKRNPVGAFQIVRSGSPWKYVGYLGVVSGVMILSFYTVIAGWTLGYLFKSLTGKLTQATVESATEVFSAFTASPLQQIFFLFIFMVLTMYIISRGVSGGIEKYAKILMPMLLVILALLLIRSLTLPGVQAGLSFYLKPNFNVLTPAVVLAAMGQAFFSLSLGMGTMITYGSYISKKENLPGAAGWIVACDVMIALLAGFIIFPAVFSQGMQPDGGPGLVFNILPVIFAQMPGGAFFGPLFFGLLAIAALTSTISLLEVPVAFLIDEKKWPRRRATLSIGALTTLIAIPSALSGGGSKFFSNMPVINMDFLSLWDKIWGNLGLSLGALLTAIYVAYIWKTPSALDEINACENRFKLTWFWVLAIKYICPFFIFIILLSLVF